MAATESALEINLASEEGLRRRAFHREKGLNLRREFINDLQSDATLDGSSTFITISNILWLAFAYGVFYYTNFYVAVLYDPMVQRYPMRMIYVELIYI